PDLSASDAARALRRELHIAARRRGAVGIRHTAADARGAHELKLERDVEQLLADAQRDRFGLVHRSDAGIIRRRVRHRLAVVLSEECGDTARAACARSSASRSTTRSSAATPAAPATSTGASTAPAAGAATGVGR